MMDRRELLYRASMLLGGALTASTVSGILAGFYQDRERTAFRAGLQAAATDGAELRGKPFADLTSEDQVMLMQQYDQQQYDYVRANAGQDAPPHFFRLMKELTITGFCTSEAGATKLMNYNQTPGPYRGDLPLSEVGKVSAL